MGIEKRIWDRFFGKYSIREEEEDERRGGRKDRDRIKRTKGKNQRKEKYLKMKGNPKEETGRTNNLQGFPDKPISNTDEKAKQHLINYSKKQMVSCSSSQLQSIMTQASLSSSQQSRSYQQQNASSRHHDYTSYIMASRKKSSEEQILKAFNFISDMNNKDQVNRALLMVETVQDRQKLVEKMLERRKQIEKAKEMQAINSMAPLFSKIKAKFLSTIRDTVPENLGVRMRKKTFKQQNTLQSEESWDKGKDGSQNEIVKISIKDNNLAVDSIEQTKAKPSENCKQDQKKTQIQSQTTGEVGIMPVSNNNNNNTNSSGMNMNMMALNIFASGDIKLDGEKEDEERRLKHAQPLGYLQRDQVLIAEDKNKLSGVSSIHQGQLPHFHRRASQGNNNSKGFINKDNESNAVIIQSSNSNKQEDFTMKLQELQKKLYQPMFFKSDQSNPKNLTKYQQYTRYQGKTTGMIGLKSGGSLGNLKAIASLTEGDQDSFQDNFSIKNTSKNKNEIRFQSCSNLQISLGKMTRSSRRRQSQVTLQPGTSYLYDFIAECEQKRQAIKEGLNWNGQNFTKESRIQDNCWDDQKGQQKYANSCQHFQSDDAVTFQGNLNDSLVDLEKFQNHKESLKRISTLNDLKSVPQFNPKNSYSQHFLASQEELLEENLHSEQHAFQKYQNPKQNLNNFKTEQRFYLKTRYLRQPLPAALILPKNSNSEKKQTGMMKK